MHGPINVKSPNNTSKWQMGFNSAFKGLTVALTAENVICKVNICFGTKEQNDRNLPSDVFHEKI
jgi:hypothetical protein